jgi:hypothetical protein
MYTNQSEGFFIYLSGGMIMEVELLKKEIKEALENPLTKDKDVFIFEKVQEFKHTPYNMDVFEVLIQQPACSSDIWEEIADVCFQVLSNQKSGERQKELAIYILEKYRQFIKKHKVDLTNHQIPDDILEFETTGKKYSKVSKLRYPLHEVDLKVLDIYDRKSLDEMEEDTILLLAMIRKRREQISQPKEEYRFSYKVYRDPRSKKQMIQLRVSKYKSVFDNKGKFLYADDEEVVSIRLPFKQSAPETVKAVNRKIKELNKKFKLNAPTF